MPAPPGELLVLTEVEAAGVLWAVPFARIDETDGAKPAGQLALARLRQGAQVGLLTDAAATDVFPRAVLAACREGRSIATPGGEIRFTGTPTLSALDLPESPEIRRLGAEQTNTSVIVGEAVVLKLLRRILPGPHPEAEMVRHLTQQGYGGTPALLGEVVRCAPDGTPHTLMLLHAFARNQGDAWGWTLDWLARTVDEAALTETEPEDLLAGYLPLAEAIGRRLAQLHLVLSRPSANPAFAPEPIDDARAGAWAEQAAAAVARALDILARPSLPLTGQEEAMAAELLASREPLLATIRSAAPMPSGLLATRLHGDFHLGAGRRDHPGLRG
jgi:maltose alpha-D-glucosyltransferase/alpha-amylase